MSHYPPEEFSQDVYERRMALRKERIRKKRHWIQG